MASIAQITGTRTRARQAADADPYMFILVGVLTLFGLVTIWSAGGAEPITLGSTVTRQAFYSIVGMGAMAVMASLNYRFLKSLAIPIYAASVLMLLAVPFIGTTIGGATRWIVVGPISFQPSDYAKVAVILALAAFLSERHDEMDSLLNFIISGLIVFVPFGLVFIEPDLGTSIVFVVIWFSMLAISKTRLLYLIGTVLLAIPIAIVSWTFLLHDYQRERLLLSYDPERDYFGGGFNIVQAHVTIGTGGWFGNGLTGGIQSEYDFLRVRDTDFIFAHAMSMFGFFGGLALMLCFLLLFHRMTRTVGVARDTFGQYVATGITAMLVFQTFVNIGMNLGLMPVTGLPLPFISLGGTALVTNLVAIGILQSILINRRSLAFEPGSPGLRRI
ncbi:MAG: rod shape-determining protein RodA [Thermomicrobiales bacterium]